MAMNDPSISISDSETWEKNKRFTVYKVVVNAGGKSWFIFRRYHEFHHLCERMKKLYPDANLKLPGKRLFDNFNPDFLKNRREGLHDFVQKLVTHPGMTMNPEIKAFLNLPTSLQDDTEPVDEMDSREEPMAVDQPVNLGPSEKPQKVRDRVKMYNLKNALAQVTQFQKTPKRRRARPSDFEFLKVIGKGSFGKVLLAKHKHEEMIYAVKVLQKAHIMKRNEVKHIMSERSVLLKNIKHPFLVGLHYSFQTADKLYFVLDYVNGGELFFHLQRERCFAESRGRFYAAEMASALGYLHSLNIIYRDLKPENILLDGQGHIVLTDFGLCKEGIEGLETTSTFCGTPEYLAPEVLRKQPYDRTVDWWCLGAVLYEMLYGLPPFYSREHAEMYDNILHKPLKLRGNISVQAKSLLEGLLQKDKQHRLGVKRDFDDLKDHPFFASISWQLLDERKIKPPYNPNVSGEMDLKHFDPEFVREPVPASVGKSVERMVSASVQDADSAFQGFSYVPPMEDSFN